MAGGAAVVWLVVMGIAVYSMVARRREHEPRRTKLYIIGGGAAFPTIALTVLLVFGLGMMPDLQDHADDSDVRIHVSGEQWWWRVRYELPDGTELHLANEVVLPVGRRVPLFLESPDVIHSFWIPSLAGKVDMIPGRVNRMALEPTRTGVFRGTCAEYCGGPHAWMGLYGVVVEPSEFDAWARAQAEPAAAMSDATAQHGAEVFRVHGCGACHTVRGTSADGLVGPDLTHVGSRRSIGAALLPNDVESFERWIAHTDELKPGVHMPAFDMLASDELRALAVYLEALQ